MGAIYSAWQYLNSIPWLEWAKVTFNAWPLALFLCAWMFRKQIRVKILEISRVSREVIDFGSQLNAPPAPNVSNVHLQASDPNYPLAHALPTVVTVAKSLESDLALVSEDQRIPVLLAKLAETRVAAQCEFLFGLIFGSQIEFLQKLSGASIPRFEAETWYDGGPRKEYAELGSWDFSTWSNFLILQGLVEQVGPDIVITQAGRDFLTYIGVNKAGFKRAL